MEAVLWCVFIFFIGGGGEEELISLESDQRTLLARVLIYVLHVGLYVILASYVPSTKVVMCVRKETTHSVFLKESLEMFLPV